MTHTIGQRRPRPTSGELRSPSGEASVEAKLKYCALIMAGRRPGEDTLAKKTGAVHRSLLDIFGEPMLERVIKTLERVHSIDRIFVSIDDPECLKLFSCFRNRIQSGSITLVPNETSISRTVYRFFEILGVGHPVLLTTSDHALLSPEMVDYFLSNAERTVEDVAVGVVTKSLLQEAYPESKRTYIPFRDDAVSGANLYSFRNQQAKKVLEFFSRVEEFRKRPVRMARAFGVRLVLPFLLRRYDIDHAMKKVSAVVGAQIRMIRLPYPEAAIDVDKPTDLEQVKRILLQRRDAPRITT